VTAPLPNPLLSAPGAGVPDAPAAPIEEWFDTEDLRRNRRYRRGTWTLGAIGLATGPVWMASVALTGRRWRAPLVRAVGRRPLPAAIAFGAGMAVAGSAVGLPLGLAGYAWGRAHGLVTQPLGSWIGDRGKEIALGTVFTTALATTTAVLMRRRTATWWLGVWGVVSAGTVLLTVVGPRLIEPLFQKTRPLDEADLESDVRDLARSLGVRVRDVVVSDASRRTTGSNAYVSGLGPTRRVVLFDTLLNDFPREQVRFVVAHELAHVSRRHIMRGWLLSAALSLPALGATGAGVAAATGLRRIGRRDADLVLRRLTVAAVGAGVFGMLAGRMGNRISCGFEREADWEALRVTGDVDAAVDLHRGLVARNLGVPDPPRWVQKLWGSHPTALERIGLALRGRG
jgi:STE24 endopeptidase